ncbi:MAG: hypothetical protein IJS46_03725, partial [Kiritimatiellae bacterium]|nr:hypothetical protein [Kiritimatiellia bacterium]
METRFTDAGELECIRVGETVFATGGGNLWEAEFLNVSHGEFSHRDTEAQNFGQEGKPSFSQCSPIETKNLRGSAALCEKTTQIESGWDDGTLGATPGAKAPACSVPGAEAPACFVPGAEAPACSVPGAEAPACSVPGAEAPACSVPGAEAPGILTVAASGGTSFERTETTGGDTVLAWRGIALGDEPGALDAFVTIAPQPDGSQKWS